jgi:hypothetical protein
MDIIHIYIGESFWASEGEIVGLWNLGFAVLGNLSILLRFMVTLF